MQRVLQAFNHRHAEPGYPPLGFINKCDELVCFERHGEALNLRDLGCGEARGARR